jgi:hypothetical protein
MNRNDTYRAMQLVRKHMNCEGSDRHELGLELERLRKTIGGMQWAEPVYEIPHKPEFEYKKRKVTIDQFPTCPSCKRMLHYSVMSDVCYSCSKEM